MNIFGSDLPDYQLIRSRRRTIALEITKEGTLVVRAPELSPVGEIERVIRLHTPWIHKTLKRTEGRILENPPKQFLEGEQFRYLGKTYALSLCPPETLAEIRSAYRQQNADDWQIPETGSRDSCVLGDFLYIDHTMAQPKAVAMAVIERWYQRQARRVVEQLCATYAGQAGLHYKAIRLTDPNSRWGSCNSHLKTLNFNWRLIMAPPDIIEYVVVHEIMHLRQANHSRAFWNLVAEYIPDYRQKRRWLKENGHLLSI
jgi:hypothetical protein